MENTAETIAKQDQLIAIETSRFGQIEVNEEKLITLTSPLLGFPDERIFILLPHGTDSPFYWLQSADNPDLAFVVIQPNIINPQYQPDIPLFIKQELKAQQEGDLDLMLILTIPPGRPMEMTANLLGPVAFNAKTRLARQMLLDPNKYDPCWPVPLGP